MWGKTMRIADELPEYLFEALLEALRRDLRREESLSACGQASDADNYRHGLNAHFNRRLLQILRPKTVEAVLAGQAGKTRGLAALADDETLAM
jgi:hypothetical protein